jgi:hypothetical protein
VQQQMTGSTNPPLVCCPQPAATLALTCADRPPVWPPQTTRLLENVASLALRTRLKEARVVTASVSADTWSLLAGRVAGARISGEGWRSPLNLTARTIEVRSLAVTGRLVSVCLQQS